MQLQSWLTPLVGKRCYICTKFSRSNNNNNPGTSRDWSRWAGEYVMDWMEKPEFFRKVGKFQLQLQRTYLHATLKIMNPNEQFGRGNDFHCLYTCPASVNAVCQSQRSTFRLGPPKCQSQRSCSFLPLWHWQCQCQRSTFVPVGHNASLNAVAHSNCFHTDTASLNAVALLYRFHTDSASVNAVCQSQRSTLVPVGRNVSLNAVEQSYRFHTDNASVDAVETPLGGELWEIITKILITSHIWNTKKESLKTTSPTQIQLPPAPEPGSLPTIPWISRASKL